MPTSRSTKYASGPAGSTNTNKNVEMSTTKGAILNTGRSARSGMMSSFWKNFPTSASSCIEP